MNINKIFTDLIKGFLSTVLIASSIIKAVGIKNFAQEAGDYIDLYLPQWLHGWNMPCAIGICFIELTVGILLIWRKQIVWTSALTLLLLTFFVWLTGVNLFFPTIFGSVESCGCFGELIHFTPMGSFVKSVVLWLLALVLFVIIVINRKHA